MSFRTLYFALAISLFSASQPAQATNICKRTWQGFVNLFNFSKSKVDTQPYYYEDTFDYMDHPTTHYTLGADVTFPIVQGDNELLYLTSPKTTATIKQEIFRRWSNNKETKGIGYLEHYLDPDWEARDGRILLTLRFPLQEGFIKTDVRKLNEVLNQELKNMVADGYFDSFIRDSQKFVYSEQPISTNAEAAELLQDKIPHENRWRGNWQDGITFTSGEGFLPNKLLTFKFKEAVAGSDLGRGLYTYAFDMRRAHFNHRGERQVGKVFPSPTGSAWLVLVETESFRFEEFTYAIFRTQAEAKRFAKAFAQQTGWITP